MVLVLDGGLGTALEARGLELTGDSLWSARLLKDDPKVIEDVHAAFYEAGAQVVTTATYQFSFGGFEAVGVGREEACEVLRQGVAIARKAAGENPDRKVAASLGSYGATLANGSEYTGDFGCDEDHLVSFHSDRFKALLADPSRLPDFVAFETLPSMQEVRAVVRVLEEAGPLPSGIRSWVSMSLNEDAKLNSGESLEDALTFLRDAKCVDMIGFNCTAPRAVMRALEIASEVAPNTPLVAYPNRGESYVNRAWVPASGVTDEDFASMLSEWTQRFSQLAVLGGCCRVGVEGIATLARKLADANVDNTAPPSKE
ncbi:Homocysteine S-methyltransferase 2 [Hondaea fermentalgiana]|uniref:Homocysteine S-methyltransferase 2 n=1 Tax=Hondaea fermentalgiana TaxID=2315210 RepID=A0A2R5H2G2_9STRA|nr:Homocysteine S-methyltransferase 2 [Hondaea fermentalgiana]|eukprot:GBG34584.1 Homocysteine S-methyltransferase 2 [Hondaea fermentalgiana]